MRIAKGSTEEVPCELGLGGCLGVEQRDTELGRRDEKILDEALRWGRAWPSALVLLEPRAQSSAGIS